MTRGRLVAFEGIDGTGKSTQAERVAARLGGRLTFEPGDTQLGAVLRSVVLDARVPATPLAEVLVMAADRAQHVAEVIVPSLTAGIDVICDRFNGSTLAYQGFGRAVPLDDIAAILRIATGGLVPDLTILLDCPVDASTARRSTGGASDRFEGDDDGFMQRVHDGFLELARTEASWAVVDAGGTIDAVSDAVDAVIAQRLS